MLISAEQEVVQTMKLAEMKKYVSTRLQKTEDTTRQLAFHISACQTIADTLGSEFQVLQTIEKQILDCRERKECLSYIEKNIGTFLRFVHRLIYIIIKIDNINYCNGKYSFADEHALRCLRLLCLLSITNNGITQNELQIYKSSTCILMVISIFLCFTNYVQSAC